LNYGEPEKIINFVYGTYFINTGRAGFRALGAAR